MRAPVEFVVARHLLGHPSDSSAEIARHCHLHPTSARLALNRLKEKGATDETRLLLQHVRTLRSRPHHRTFTFRAPNPDQFAAALVAPHWISGEYAAAAEGFDLVPERLTLYVKGSDLAKVSEAAIASFAKVAPKAKANVEVKVADPWLHLPVSALYVERGQRLLDYEDSRHIQILKALRDA